MAVLSRYYETVEQAQNAYQGLLDVGYSERMVAMLRGSSTSPADDSTADAVKVGSILGRENKEYKDYLARGLSVVAIETPYGKTSKAIQVLDSHSPITTPEMAADDRNEPKIAIISEQATPLSSSFGLKVLNTNQQTTSASLGFGTLTEKRSFLPLLGELTRSDFSLSGMFGLSCLTNNSAPYSPYLGSPLSRDKSGDGWTRSHGFKMLSDNADPLSSITGIPPLLGDYYSGSRSTSNDNPAPFSRIFGLKLLSSKSQTVLSEMFPALTSSRFSLFGFPNLSNNAAPLSSMFRLPCLSQGSGDSWRFSFGLPLLSSSSAPLSKSVGLPVLTNE